MKFVIILSFLLVNSTLFAQNECSECEKFKIVGVYDFGPPPGGNWIILLLTVTEDLDAHFDPFYSSLFFISNQGDTITIPLGPSYTLPELTSDTIPYIMELNTELSNQDFPIAFDGRLIIRTPTGPPCPNVTWCNINFSNITSGLTDLKDEARLLKIYPNPFNDKIKIETEELIDNIRIYNQLGQVVYSSNNFLGEVLIHLEKMESKFLIIMVKFKNGEFAIRKIMKSE